MTDPNGLYYMRARYYHPGLKRFLNRDVLRGEITDGQTFNLFAYVNGDPVGFIDPLGLMKYSKDTNNNTHDTEPDCKLGKNPTRKQAFNQAKRDAGIPTSMSPVKQGWVNVNNRGKTGEPMKVYQFVVKESEGFVEKYIIEHRNDPNGRGLHFHVATTKYDGQNLFQEGERYKNLGKDPDHPHVQGHYPEDKDGFTEGRKRRGRW